MRFLKQSTTRNLMVFLVDSTDHVTGKTGLTLTITASKDGAAFIAITPTVTERGTGWYNLALTTAHTDTLGDLALHITGTAADPLDLALQVGDVATTSNIKKNQALANFEFLMTDSTNHQPVTGKTVTCTRSIDGGAFAAGTLANVAEVSNGIYRVDFGAGDLNGNAITLRCTATAADDTLVTLVTAP